MLKKAKEHKAHHEHHGHTHQHHPEEDTLEQEPSWVTKAGVVLLEVTKVVILAVLFVVLVRHYLFKPFYVKGQSMEPTFYGGEYLIIDELSYRFRNPERGETIVFRAPVQEKDFYLKRVIGLPGERVKVADNKVVIYNSEHPEGVVLDEHYLVEDVLGEVTLDLGPDQFFVMGDNRDSSYDSRRFGAIEKSSIVGRTWLRGYPFTRAGIFNTPKYNL